MRHHPEISSNDLVMSFYFHRLRLRNHLGMETNRTVVWTSLQSTFERHNTYLSSYRNCRYIAVGSESSEGLDSLEMLNSMFPEQARFFYIQSAKFASRHRRIVTLSIRRACRDSIHVCSLREFEAAAPGYSSVALL